MGVQPQEFYPSANQCFEEELMQVRHQGLQLMGPSKHNTDQHVGSFSKHENKPLENNCISYFFLSVIGFFFLIGK